MADFNKQYIGIGEVISGKVLTGERNINKVGKESGDQLQSGSAEEISQVVIQAPYDNTGTLYIGTSSFQAIELKPGDSIVVATDRLGELYYSGDQTAVDNNDHIDYLASVTKEP